MEFYEFSPFTLDWSSREVLCRDQRVELTDRELDTLHAIVRRLGQPVSREMLLEEVWRDVSVDPNNVSQQIASLRRKLKLHSAEPGGADGQQVIRTHVGRGYYVASKLRRSTEPAAPAPAP